MFAGAHYRFGTTAIASISTNRSERHKRAWMPVLAGKGSSPNRAHEQRPYIVERVVVALDVPQVARRSNDIVPTGTFGDEQASEISVRPETLCLEVSRVNRRSLLVNTGGAGKK